VDADRPGRSRPSESAAPGDAENVAPMSMLLVVAYGLQPIPLLVLVVILHAVATRNACSRREFKRFTPTSCNPLVSLQDCVVPLILLSTCAQTDFMLARYSKMVVICVRQTSHEDKVKVPGRKDPSEIGSARDTLVSQPNLPGCDIIRSIREHNIYRLLRLLTRILGLLLSRATGYLRMVCWHRHL
jgi:hypothetical protein